MSVALYAWRIWRLDPNPYGVTSVPVSEIRPALTSATTRHRPNVWTGPGEDTNYPRWATRRMDATCHKGHSAPQKDCICGIYAYPDLLDVLRLIPVYCGDSMYAIGLIEGYGGKHNDGEIMMHDACMRLADVDIVGFAQLGSGWRTGVLQRVADDLRAPVMPVAELQAMAAKGDPVLRRKLAGKDSLFLESHGTGRRTVAESALIVDQNARVYLRNDREALLPDKNQDAQPMSVWRLGSGRFKVHENYMPDGRLFLPLPFDGEAELANGNRLAGEVGIITNRRGRRFREAGKGQVVLPPIHRYHLIDTLPIGKRLPVCAGIEIAKQGIPYLARVVREDDPEREGSARAFLTRVDESSFALDLEGNGVLHLPRVIGDKGYRPPIFDMDTPVSRLTVNGGVIADCELSFKSVIYGGNNCRIDLEVAQ